MASEVSYIAWIPWWAPAMVRSARRGNGPAQGNSSPLLSTSQSVCHWASRWCTSGSSHLGHWLLFVLNGPFASVIIHTSLHFAQVNRLPQGMCPVSSIRAAPEPLGAAPEEPLWLLLCDPRSGSSTRLLLEHVATCRAAACMVERPALCIGSVETFPSGWAVLGRDATGGSSTANSSFVYLCGELS